MMGWKAVKEHYRIGHSVQIVPGKGICIGSAYIHDIIVISEDGAVVKRYDPGHGWSVNEALARYQSEIEADPGKFSDLFARPDEFGPSISVYTYEGGDIIECTCEQLGWPNVTHDGRMMYENEFSPDRAKVVKWARRSAESGIEAWSENVKEAERRLAEASEHLARCQRDLALLEKAGA